MNSSLPTSEARRPRTALPVLSNSEKRCFQSCKRQHFYRYRLLKRPVASAEPVRFGALVLEGVRAWWRAAKTGADRLTAALDALARVEMTDAFERAKAGELVVGYHARWEHEVVDVLAVAADFEAPIVNPATGAESRTFVLGGTIDVVARLADGRVCIVKHKTTTEDIEAGSDYWKRLRLDSQVSDYFVGAKALGYDVESCVYDVIGKPRLARLLATPEETRKYKKDGTLYANQRAEDESLDDFRARVRAHIAENIDRLYVRGEVERTAEDERDAAFDTWQTARDVRDADLSDRRPRNPDACVRFGSTCEFFAVCAREADLDDATRFRTAANDDTNFQAA